MNARLDESVAPVRQPAADARLPFSDTRLPFDQARLDRLLDEAGIDILILCSKHNIQYLLGGYRFFFFDHFDANGVSRYLPLLVYPKGDPTRAFYVGNGMEEAYEKELGKFWMSDTASAGTSVAAVERAAAHLARVGMSKARIGVERSFLPADAEEALRRALPGATVVEAHRPLETLRARKTPTELAYLREASERVVASMLAVIAGHGPGATKQELVEALRREEVSRGLTFEYCLVATGASFNRAPSDAVWREGEILSLDSGGNYRGYIGDLCRMAILGEPDAELRDLLAAVDAVQMAARKPIRAGTRGGDIFVSAEEALKASPIAAWTDFVAHGMGLVTHEAPRLAGRGSFPYPADHAELPLEADMVISIETTLKHPRRGFIKLEDTVAVTADGWEGFGDIGRGWNRGGTGIA
jgi:Xaa-Pro aminopeptidase